MSCLANQNSPQKFRVNHEDGYGFLTLTLTPAFLSVPWGSDVRQSDAKYVPFVPALIFCPRLDESGETELVELHN